MNCQNTKILDHVPNDVCNQYTIRPTPLFASPGEIPPPPIIEHEAEPPPPCFRCLNQDSGFGRDESPGVLKISYIKSA